MRVYVASDHAGLELRIHVVRSLELLGHDVRDLGPEDYDSNDSYVPYCVEAGTRVIADEGSLGVVIGGSGNGEQMAANKVRGIRAALAWNTETASLARRHNNAQIVAVGARMHTAAEATAIVVRFIDTPFSFDPRHDERIAMLGRYEESGQPPPVP